MSSEHTAEPVPSDATVHGVRVALVLIGIAITIPSFLSGAELGLALGLRKVTFAIVVGSGFLCVLGCFAAVIAAETRLTTYQIIEFSFGTLGAKVVNGVLAVTIFGWFAVTASFFGESIHHALRDMWGIDADVNGLIAVGSILSVATALVGFRAIDRLALLAVPFLFVALIGLVYFALRDTSFAILDAHPSGPMPSGQAITAVVGGFIVGAVIIPDYCRFVRSRGHGLLAAVLHFGVAYPLILLMLAVVAIESGQKDFIRILSAMGFGVVGLLVIVFATWTTNVGNLYSNALVVQTVVTRWSQRPLVLVLGALGTVLAMMGVTQYFISFLLVLGIGVPPIIGIYVADYFLVRRKKYGSDVQPEKVGYTAFVAWGLASGIAYATTYGSLQLTGVAACDAVMLAFFIYWIGSRAGRTRPLA